MKKSLTLLLIFLVALLALPFALRPKSAPGIGKACDTLVIISAHNKSIRDEYERSFAEYYRARHGRDIHIDFRNLGGTSDIVRYLADRYEAEFRKYYEQNPVCGAWDEFLAASFADPRSDRPDAPERAKKIRKIFLDSNVGVGIDLMAGGGVYDLARQADRGYAVDAQVKARHPEYFTDAVMPAQYGGGALYDPAGRYYSVVLSTFGICVNLDRIRELGIAAPPRKWSDLADPRYFGTLTSADPTKSGSVTKGFEIIIQQCMSEAGDPAVGWENGLNLIKHILGNCRNIGDNAGAIVHDVGTGDSAAGIAIDTYALSQIEYQKENSGGASRLEYITPQGGTSVSGDPIQLLRGAPHPEIAQEFIDFLLSDAGQKLHCYRPGTPGGPQRYALNRPPVRRDIYDESYQKYAFRADYNPYVSGADFVYRPEWTGRYYQLIRQLIKVIMLDCHPELVAAHRAIIRAGGPEKVPEAMREFNALPFSYRQATAAAQNIAIHPGCDAVAVARTLRSWSDAARQHYIRAKNLAEAGK